MIFFKNSMLVVKVIVKYTLIRDIITKTDALVRTAQQKVLIIKVEKLIRDEYSYMTSFFKLK
jgi:hypothetical protein